MGWGEGFKKLILIHEAVTTLEKKMAELTKAVEEDEKRLIRLESDFKHIEEKVALKAEKAVAEQISKMTATITQLQLNLAAVNPDGAGKMLPPAGHG